MVYDPRQDPKYKNDRLFLSLLNRESRFNPNAVSPTGARGYAQLLKSTAADPGFGIAPNPAAIHDPEQNVAFGKSYLEAMKKRYKGDTAAALVAYNGGPGAADRWVKSGKDDKVISHESRNYYKNILKDAGEGYDFSKVKTALPKAVPASSDEDDEETTESTGFAKLKRPGKEVASVAKPIEGTTDSSSEAGDDEEEETTTKEATKVKKTKASKSKDDEDDDEDDDEEDSKSSKGSGFAFDPSDYVPKLSPYSAGPMQRPVAIQLGSPKLQVAQLQLLDDPKER